VANRYLLIVEKFRNDSFIFLELLIIASGPSPNKI